MDDNLDSRELVRFMLQENGYDVTCIESGRGALVLLENEGFDLLILDNWVPGLTGTELTQRINISTRPLRLFSTLQLRIKLTKKPPLMLAHRLTL